MDAPRFSVLVPLEDARELGMAGVRSWLTQQDFPRAAYEVIALLATEDAELAAQLRPALSPHDRLIVVGSDSISAVYDAGARAARGDVLVLTEGHCRAEPNYLTEIDRALRVHGWSGAIGHSIGQWSNDLSRLDHLLHEEGAQVFRRPGDWRKVDVHGFALKRAAFWEAGGFDRRYDRFAEMVLAWRLRHWGHVLGYVPTARVHHHYRATVAELWPDFAAYARGEMLFRWDHPGPDALGFTFLEGCFQEGSSSSPLHYAPRTLALGRHLAATLARHVAVPLASAALGRLLARWGPHLAFGSAWARLTAAVNLGVTYGLLTAGRVCRYQVETLYRQLWRRGLWRGALHAVTTEPFATPAAHATAVEQMHETDSFNLHAFETHAGRRFRWTDETGALRLNLPARATRLHWDTGGLRRELADDARVYFFHNGDLLPPEWVKWDEGGVTLQLPAASGMRHLAWLIPPLCPWRHGVSDPRRLGLPLFELSLVDYPCRISHRLAPRTATTAPKS